MKVSLFQAQVIFRAVESLCCSVHLQDCRIKQVCLDTELARGTCHTGFYSCRQTEVTLVKLQNVMISITVNVISQFCFASLQKNCLIILRSHLASWTNGLIISPWQIHKLCSLSYTPLTTRLNVVLKLQEQSIVKALNIGVFPVW